MAELLYQALETEMGGVKVYEKALTCVQNEDLREEWEKYLDQTRNHVAIAREVCAEMGLDPDYVSPGRRVVLHIGEALLKAMDTAKSGADPRSAEIVAAECVVLAESKDHANWELIGMLAKEGSDEETNGLENVSEEVEAEEDEHLYHSQGWARELWRSSLGLRATLPPPEETEDVKTESEAARVRKASSTAKRRSRGRRGRSR